MWLNLSPYIKSELKTVKKGATTMSLSKKRPTDKLLIIDTTYSMTWMEGFHYTLNDNVIIFKNPLPRTIDFIIYILAY